jgi:TonB family protein
MPVQTGVFAAADAVTPKTEAAPSRVTTGHFGGLLAKDSPVVNEAPRLGAFAGIGNSHSSQQESSAEGTVIGGFSGGHGQVRGTNGTQQEVARATVFGRPFSRPGEPGGEFGPVSHGSFDRIVARPAAGSSLAPEPDRPEIIPLEILSKPRPVYTAEARQLQLEGEVVLKVRFRAGGGVEVLEILRRLGHGLDEAAIRAAEAIVFRPATRAGEPVDAVATVRIRFQLAY